MRVVRVAWQGFPQLDGPALNRESINFNQEVESMNDDTDLCTCGHVNDEHEPGFISPCTVEGCDCRDFEKAEEQPA
jgi:hypothetical protein